MRVTRRVALVEDARFLGHRGPPGHPEQPSRLHAVGEALGPLRQRLAALPARAASDREILRIHSARHLAAVTRAVARAPTKLDPDTYVGPDSLRVARLAAGAAVDLARQVAQGEASAGFAAIRPPGHHAEASRAMGFCLFNNVAIAARALQAEEGVERILIVDFDVHHGNGTQHSFWSDPSVLYFSTHQFPYYPGSGDFAEVGTGRGEGATLNVPLPAGCGDAEYVGVFQRLLEPAARHFQPEMILVSAGFDAHADDPLAAMRVSGAGYAALSGILRGLADALCGGRLVFLLEGGYSESGLREGTAAILAAALAPDCPPPPAQSLAPGNSVLARVVPRVVACHAGGHLDLAGA